MEEGLLKKKDIPEDDLHKKATMLTRCRIPFSAMQYMAARGNQKISIRDIVKLARVTYDPLYHHFKDKKASYLHLFSKRWP